MAYEVVGTLKQRLLLYGTSTSGRKQDLIDRLKPLMDVPAPDIGPGSWYHFNKKETVVSLEDFCRKNHIMMKSGYVKIHATYHATDRF